MPNLLYVTQELIEKLHTHRAYLFWSPIISNFPIRPVPLDERIFHPRTVKVKNGSIYLTTDMKFAYCSENLLSFLYTSQDLSFRLTAKDGILMTVDGKQFAAVLGRVADVISTSDVELQNVDKVFHPYFDNGYLGSAPVAPPKPSTKTTKVAPPAIQKAPKAKKKEEPAFATKDGDTELVLGKYATDICEDLVNFRNTSKKSYSYLAQKYDIPVDDVKGIIRYYTRKKRAEQNSQGREAIEKIPKETRELIVRMKKVSKKSYNYLAKRFDLPVETVQDICAEFLKRPRQRH